MTDGASGTAARPAATQPQAQPTAVAPTPSQTQAYDAIRALLRAGKNDEAIVRASSIAIARPDDLVAKELLFDAFFQKRDWPPALALAEELARRAPQVARLEKALIATLSNMKRYDQAITQAFQYIVRHGAGRAPPPVIVGVPDTPMGSGRGWDFGLAP
jgi:tetratricopeptide (TPR) repeat protein